MSRSRERRGDERRGRRQAFEALVPHAAASVVSRRVLVPVSRIVEPRDVVRSVGLQLRQPAPPSVPVVRTGSVLRALDGPYMLRLRDVIPASVAPSVVQRAEFLRLADAKLLEPSSVEVAASVSPSLSLSVDNRRLLRQNDISLSPEVDNAECLSENRPISNRGSGGSRFVPWCQKGKK